MKTVCNCTSRRIESRSCAESSFLQYQCLSEMVKADFRSLLNTREQTFMIEKLRYFLSNVMNINYTGIIRIIEIGMEIRIRERERKRRRRKNEE